MDWKELVHINSEIESLHNESDDLDLLLALLNNAIFVLDQIQKKELSEHKPLTVQVMSDLLNTNSKEMLWAMEEQDLLEKHKWFIKAKKRIIEDLKPLISILENEEN